MNIKDLRMALRPKGKKDIVRLHMENPWFKHDVVERAINHLQAKMIVEDGLNPLELLAVYLLFDSAGMKPENKVQD